MRRISLSEMKKQEPEQKLAEGFGDDADSQHMLSDLILLMVEKTLQEILKAEQSEVLGRERYEHGEQATTVHRNGYEPGTLKTAETVYCA